MECLLQNKRMPRQAVNAVLRWIGITPLLRIMARILGLYLFYGGHRPGSFMYCCHIFSV